jgi:NAD(P)-dependent dehydrogenase (short-subunit alcohol dehydrogenase family)
MTESALRFDGRVAVVTGAGGGLGRAYARYLAARGASVVVNDAGVAVDGSGGTSDYAQQVADEIADAGGTAVANSDSVAEPGSAAALVQTAVDSYGGIDILINNAGTTGRSSMAALDHDRLHTAFATHLEGSFYTICSAWPHMVDRGYGRIVNTGSGVGYFGMANASIYAAAKMGIDGLTRSLATECAPHDIRVNCVAPLAQTRMAGTVYGDLADKLDPDLVASVVAYLAHESCAVNGRTLSAGGGRVAEVFVAVTEGFFDPALTAETVAAHLDEATDRTAVLEPTDALDEVAFVGSRHSKAMT